MTTVHDPERKRALVLRLKRVEGQLRGIQKLIETDSDCEKVAQQLAAARDEQGRLRQTQEQITQTLAELAEQNTRLVAAVDLLRKRTRLLMGAVLVLAVALGALWFNAA